MWETIKSNSEFVSQFADREDCFIPFAEAEVVHKGSKVVNCLNPVEKFIR